MSDTPGEDKDTSASAPQPQKERRKIEIKFIQDKTRRHITFSKRKHGIMKKAYELSVLTGTQVLLLVVSETGLVYTFTTPKFQPIVTQPEGKNLIQACLNAPEDDEEDDQDDDDQEDDEEAKVDVSAASAAATGVPSTNAAQPSMANAPAPHMVPVGSAGQPVDHTVHPQPVQQPTQPGQQAYGNPAAYLNAEQAAVYHQYFNGVNSQQGQY
ncbi:LAFE_0H01926g1_1 [Lachancea fermentati]|uniref:LAFE_0H01926g1_1 n=1 Tax=Lachancea fermentati TaxID=4955 RepID=A0A1G4MJJ5_LACFM|nr:LAFE_0H01926g1_1 [Lachancea fermentati]